MPVPPKKLRLVDSCAYLGVQGVLVMFGCGFLFLVSFAIFFILLWRTDFTNRLGALWVPLFVFAMLLYGVMLYLSRVRNRSAWALGELLETTLHLGTSLFTMPVRCAIGAVRQLATWFWLHNARHEAHSGMPTLYGGLGNSLFDASLYVQHQHNNPVVRVMVDRIHRELRNHDTLRRFSPANIEPLRLRRETLEHRAHHDTTRVKAKLVLLLLTKANPHLSLEKARAHPLRKHYVAKAVAADKLLDDD
ncbi:hypothetical protein T484DRAFT_1806651 [Baffinella frigidus]|nr:hypothetical protein T484DRAFT_1806651 [Cryptophyta sp. CCMP2293]